MKESCYFNNVPNYILLVSEIDLYIVIGNKRGETYRTMYDIHSKFHIFNSIEPILIALIHSSNISINRIGAMMQARYVVEWN